MEMADETVGHERDNALILHHTQQEVARNGGLGEGIRPAHDDIAGLSDRGGSESGEIVGGSGQSKATQRRKRRGCRRSA